MTKEEILYDYDSDLDILHIYSTKINQGIKGCITLGDYTVDIAKDNSIVGIEIEQASKMLQLGELSKLDEVKLIVRKVGNSLFIGFVIIKNKKESTFQFSIPYHNSQIKLIN